MAADRTDYALAARLRNAPQRVIFSQTRLTSSKLDSILEAQFALVLGVVRRVTYLTSRLWLEPRVSTVTHKFVVIQFGIGTIRSINLLLLSRAERLPRIEAPGTLEQTLLP